MEVAQVQVLEEPGAITGEVTEANLAEALLAKLNMSFVDASRSGSVLTLTRNNGDTHDVALPAGGTGITPTESSDCPARRKWMNL